MRASFHLFLTPHEYRDRISWGPEYYNVGHDDPFSILTLPIHGVPNLKLKDLTPSQLSSVAFLYGGCGDCRHIFATLNDLCKQLGELNETQEEASQQMAQ